MKLKECIVELDGVLKKEKLEIFEEKLKFRKLKIQLHGHLPEMESLLEKLKREKKGLWSQALEMELKEDLENLELSLEETKLEERHAAKLKRFIVKAEKINSVPNESKTKSDKLEMQFEKRKEELKSLLYELEYFPRSIGTCQIKIWRQREAKLEFLLEGIELKQGEERLLSRELKMELKQLEWLVKEIESERHIEVPESLALKMRLEGHLGKVKSLLEAVKMEHEEENPELPAMKVQLEDRILHRNKIMFLTFEQQFKKCIEALNSLEGKLSLIQFTGELKSQALKMELDKHIGELESLLKKEMKFETSGKLSFKNWGTHIQKSKSLLNNLEWECNEEILQPLVWEMILKGHTAKEKSVLPQPFATELKQHIVQLESLIAETKLKQEEGLKPQILSMELQLKLLELELLQKERRLEMMLKSPVSNMEQEENIAEVKSRLKTVKLEREKQKTELKALEVKMKQEKQKPESPPGTRELRPGEQEVLYKPIGALHVIVIGGRDQDGQSLNSVEGYIFLEGRWIELSAMNTPRSFMSSVVVGQEVIVSGGDTGDAITDTIEVLNLAETPLQWKISPAKLPVPLSAHQTVVYEGKLIVIGGHDGNEGRRSDRIYEVRLTPPYTTRILTTMDTPVAWHGAALMGDEIFIFGGEIGGYVPTPDVLVFDLNSNMLSERQPLPRAVKGMATVVQEQSVAVIGGLDRNDQELDSVFMYDTRSGERHDLPQMSEERGACCAAISFTLDTGGYTDALFVAGSVRSVNTVERFSFGSHRWIDMPPTREARGFCSIVNAPELPLE